MHHHPLVSLLVRSMARPTLYRTLGSLALLSGTDIEVVVVNASGVAHPPLADRCGPHPLRLCNPGRPLARAAAANVALQQALGRWVMLVDDDDDSVDATHVERLRQALLADPEAAAAYAGVRLLRADGSVAGVLDEPFDLLRLHCENFLPIHAVLFSRAAVADGASDGASDGAGDGANDGPGFDESFDVHEDWDFWLRLAQRQRFVHVAGVSASYHLVGESGLTHEADTQVTDLGRQRFFAKWAPLLKPDLVEKLAHRAQLDRSKAQALEGEQQRLHAASAEQGRALEQERAALQEAQRGLAWLREQERAALTLSSQAQHLLHEAQTRAQHATAQWQQAQSELQSELNSHWQASEAQLQAHVAELSAAQTDLSSQREQTRQLQTQLMLAISEAQAVQQRWLAEQAATARVRANLDERVAELQALQQQRDQDQQAQALHQQLQQQQQQQLQQAIERQGLQTELEATGQYTRRLLADLAVVNRSYRQLGAGYGEVTQSLSWRATQPPRKVCALLSGHNGVSLARKLALAEVRRLPVSGLHKQRLKVWMAARPWAARW